MFGNILAQATVAALRIGFVRDMASADGDVYGSRQEYQELPSGDAEEGLDNAEVWEPPLDSAFHGPIEWF